MDLGLGNEEGTEPLVQEAPVCLMVGAKEMWCVPLQEGVFQVDHVIAFAIV